jgi:hypothetical protein
MVAIRRKAQSDTKSLLGDDLILEIIQNLGRFLKDANGTERAITRHSAKGRE